MSKPINILFLCVANSARSQLAEGLAKHLFENEAEIQSAGSLPSGVVQPWAVNVLSEIGIDISKNKSKAVQDLPNTFLENLNYVVTLCAEEVCPVLPTQAVRLHWPIPDPAAAEESLKPQAFREAREDIRQRLLKFKKEISK